MIARTSRLQRSVGGRYCPLDANILKMGLRYGLRRLTAALLTATILSLPLALFFFPVTVVKEAYGHRTDAGIICFTGTEFISFRPIWQLDGLPPDGIGLVLQILIVLSLSAGVWALYPAFKPVPR